MESHGGIDIKIKNKLVELLGVLFPGAQIYLYGSRANRNLSDIDLAIDAGKAIARTELSEARSILESVHMPYKIDLVDINNTSTELRNDILSKGVLWNR
ncbi:MAG: polymerase, beta domain protein region protein [candidate division TM6 bacterium GW2011_GWF2_37_49]|nr:MAG: polymerase, beta domain protein region protein [candidate division TM6 bacterium GW2011_GWF2_37_49]